MYTESVAERKFVYFFPLRRCPVYDRSLYFRISVTHSEYRHHFIFIRNFKSFIDMEQRQIRSDLNYFIDDRGELYFEDEHIKTKEAWDKIEQDLLKLKIEPGDELIINHERNIPSVESGQESLGKVAKKKIIKPKKTKKND